MFPPRASTVQPTTPLPQIIRIKQEKIDGERPLPSLPGRPRSTSVPILSNAKIDRKTMSTMAKNVRSLLRPITPSQRRFTPPVRRRSTTRSPSPAPSSVNTQTTSGLRFEPTASPVQPYRFAGVNLPQRQGSVVTQRDDDDDISIVGSSSSVTRGSKDRMSYNLILEVPDCWPIKVPFTAQLIQDKVSSFPRLERRMRKMAHNLARDIADNL